LGDEFLEFLQKYNYNNTNSNNENLRKVLIDHLTPESVKASLPAAHVRDSMKNRVLDSLQNSPIDGLNILSTPGNIIDLQTPNIVKLSPLDNLNIKSPKTPITPVGTTDPFSDI
jgi:hypothetical protein